MSRTSPLARTAPARCTPAARACLVPHGPGKWRADLPALARLRLQQAGVAELRGKTLQQRAQALIGVAHPDHREALARSAREQGVLGPGAG